VKEADASLTDTRTCAASMYGNVIENWLVDPLAVYVTVDTGIMSPLKKYKDPTVSSEVCN
jgi:hypothetical protein